MATTRRQNDSGLRFGEGGVRERIRRDGAVTYQARWWDADVRATPVLRSKTFATRDDAEDFLRTVVRAKKADTYRSPSMMTVTDLVREYIDRSGSRISERTMLTYRKRASAMIEPTIGKRKLESIKPLDIQRWIDAMGRLGFKPSTIHSAVAVLMGALREAALLGITERHLGVGIRRPTIRRAEATIWSEQDVRKVVSALESDLIFDCLYRVAIATGMRPGELRALNWADVDLDRGIIRVRRTITKDIDGHEIIAMRTKTNAGRAIALAPAVVSRLRWHRARQHERQLAHDAWQPMGLVFDRGDGHWLYQSQWLRYHIDLCERAVVPRIRHHDLRHSCASLLMSQNVHPKVVSEMLGHANVAITLDLYSHSNPTLQRNAANALAERLFEDEPEGHIVATLT